MCIIAIIPIIAIIAIIAVTAIIAQLRGPLRDDPSYKWAWSKHAC